MDRRAKPGTFAADFNEIPAILPTAQCLRTPHIVHFLWIRRVAQTLSPRGADCTFHSESHRTISNVQGGTGSPIGREARRKRSRADSIAAEASSVADRSAAHFTPPPRSAPNARYAQPALALRACDRIEILSRICSS